MARSDKELMKPIRTFLTKTAALSILAFAACSSPPASTATTTPQPAAADPEDIAHTAFDPSLGIHLDSMVRRPSGLYVQNLVMGTGPVAVTGRSVVVRYTG